MKNKIPFENIKLTCGDCVNRLAKLNGKFPVCPHRNLSEKPFPKATGACDQIVLCPGIPLEKKVLATSYRRLRESINCVEDDVKKIQAFLTTGEPCISLLLVLSDIIRHATIALNTSARMEGYNMHQQNDK